MSYLTNSDITTLCDGVIEGVEPSDVAMASDLVDAYLGRSYRPSKKVDRVKLIRGKGKLSHSPVISIESVKGIFKNIFGSSTSDLKIEDIDLDPENDGYFAYVGDYGLNALVLGNKPTMLEIEYITGFTEYPSRLKTAVAMLACNIREAKSFAGAKQMTSLDFQVLMADDSFFTSDIKMLLKGLSQDEYV